MTAISSVEFGPHPSATEVRFLLGGKVVGTIANPKIERVNAERARMSFVTSEPIEFDCIVLTGALLTVQMAYRDTYAVPPGDVEIGFGFSFNLGGQVQR